MTTTTHDVSFVTNQPRFFLIGFDYSREQWKYTVQIGSETFDYSGGLWAFVPNRSEALAKIKFRFGANSRAADTLRHIESGRVRISKNADDKDVRAVVSAIQPFNKPEAASIFYSLLSDMDAGEMTFHDFCSDLGYDSDSIKDLETHRACEANSRKFRKVVTAQEIEQLREALQD